MLLLLTILLLAPNAFAQTLAGVSITRECDENGLVFDMFFEDLHDDAFNAGAHIQNGRVIFSIDLRNEDRRSRVLFGRDVFRIALDEFGDRARVITGEWWSGDNRVTYDRLIAARWSPRAGPRYHDYQFVTPEFLDTAHLLEPGRAAAVKKIAVRRFAELTPDERENFARAVTLKEAEVHGLSAAPGDAVIAFEKDRHEGNYLLVTDERVLKALGAADGKVILVIDFAQFADVATDRREALLDAVALLGAWASRLVSEEGAAARLAPLVGALVRTARRPNAEDVRRHLTSTVGAGADLRPGEMLARLLAYLEADGFAVEDDVIDYLTALATLRAWDAILPNNDFDRALGGQVFARCARLLAR